MFKLLFAGVWASMVALGAVYATMKYKAPREAHAADPKPSSIETRKTKEINIPKIASNALKGYVVISLTFVVDRSLAAKLPVSPDPYVVEETFRYIYNDDAIDFVKPKKYDLKLLTDSIRNNVNERVKSDVIVEVVLQELHFLAGSDFKQKL